MDALFSSLINKKIIIKKNEVVMANQDFVEVDSMQDSTIKLRMLKYTVVIGSHNI